MFVEFAMLEEEFVDRQSAGQNHARRPECNPEWPADVSEPGGDGDGEEGGEDATDLADDKIAGDKATGHADRSAARRCDDPGQPRFSSAR